MSQIDAKNERAAIQATARAIVRTTTRQDIAQNDPPPEWAVVHAKVMLGHLRAAGHSLSPCEPDPAALNNPMYSIMGRG